MENCSDLVIDFDIDLGELPYRYIYSAYIEMEVLTIELNEKL